MQGKQTVQLLICGKWNRLMLTSTSCVTCVTQELPYQANRETACGRRTTGLLTFSLYLMSHLRECSSRAFFFILLISDFQVIKSLGWRFMTWGQTEKRVSAMRHATYSPGTAADKNRRPSLTGQNSADGNHQAQWLNMNAEQHTLGQSTLLGTVD